MQSSDTTTLESSPAQVTQTGTCVVTAVFSSKGGIGKTSICCNVAGYLADLGYKVCIIDADQQQSANQFYAVTKLAKGGFVQLVKAELPAMDCVSETNIDNLCIVLGNDVDKSLNAWIRGSGDRCMAMKAAVNKLRPHFEYLIIDSQGSDGSGECQELALRACDKILFPITADALEVRESLNNGFNVLNRLMPEDPSLAYFNIPSPHVFIYRNDPNNPAHVEYVKGIRQVVGDKQDRGEAILLDTQIPVSNVYNAAQAGKERVPVHRIDSVRRSSKQKKPCAAEGLRSLVKEVYDIDAPEVLTDKPYTGSDNSVEKAESPLA